MVHIIAGKDQELIKKPSAKYEDLAGYRVPLVEAIADAVLGADVPV